MAINEERELAALVFTKDTLFPSFELVYPNGDKVEDGGFEEEGIHTVRIPADAPDERFLLQKRNFLFWLSNLQKIELEPDSPCFKLIDGVLFSKDGKVLYCHPRGMQREQYRIPEGTEILAERAFARCRLGNVEFPNSLKKIGDSAFQGCFLRQMILPPELEEIEGGGALFAADCQLVQFPDSLKKIGHSWKPNGKVGLPLPKNAELKLSPPMLAFLAQNDIHLEKSDNLHIVIPHSYTADELFFLLKICSPKRITILPGHPQYQMLNEMFEHKLESGPKQPWNLWQLWDVRDEDEDEDEDSPSDSCKVEPASVEQLASRLETVFHNQTTLILANRYQTIDKSMFGLCDDLICLVLPEGVKTIEAHAFSGCGNLTKVVLPESVEQIAEDAFDDCPEITLTVTRGSWAEKYGLAHKIRINYIDCECNELFNRLLLKAREAICFRYDWPATIHFTAGFVVPETDCIAEIKMEKEYYDIYHVPEHLRVRLIKNYETHPEENTDWVLIWHNADRDKAFHDVREYLYGPGNLWRIKQLFLEKLDQYALSAKSE